MVHPILECYLSSYGPFVSLGTLRKWLEVVPHPRMDFRILGTSITKFGISLTKFVASNPRATKTPILLSMVHLFLWKPMRKWLEVISHPKWTLEPLVYLLQNLVHPILEIPIPLSYYPWSVCSFKDPWEVIGGCSPPWKKLRNPRYFLIRNGCASLISLFFCTYISRNYVCS